MGRGFFVVGDGEKQFTVAFTVLFESDEFFFEGKPGESDEQT